MAYRELGMIELREVVRRWLAGDGFRAIGRATRIDRKTVARYVWAAVAVGLRRSGPRPRTSKSPPCGTSSRGTRRQPRARRCRRWRRTASRSARG